MTGLASDESSYVGRHADYYDVIYAQKDYAGEAAFVHELLKQQDVVPGSEMLELACGTGTHAIEFTKLGYQVTATDYSADMLRIAAAKCAREARAIELRRLDMRNVASVGRKYSAIVCLFDSIGYVRTNEAVAEVLAGVRTSLAPGGVFVFEFWHAPAMQRGFDPTRVRRFPLGDGELVRFSETRLDVGTQLATVSYDLIELKANGTFSRIRESQTNRFFSLPEMRAYLFAAGLDLIEANAGFKNDPDIGADTWHVVAAARAR